MNLMKTGCRITYTTITAFMLLLGLTNSALASPNIKNRYYYEQSGAMIWEVPTSQKVIALTFDDGPDPSETTQILNVLHQYHAKCTFLLSAKKLPPIPR